MSFHVAHGWAMIQLVVLHKYLHPRIKYYPHARQFPGAKTDLLNLTRQNSKAHHCLLYDKDCSRLGWHMHGQRAPTSLGSIFVVLSRHDHPFVMLWLGHMRCGGWEFEFIQDAGMYAWLALVIVHYLIVSIVFMDGWIMDVLARASQATSICRALSWSRPVNG